MHQKLAQFRGDAKVTTWLYRITETVVHHQRRKDRWRKFWRPVDSGDAQEAPSQEPSAPERIAQAEAQRALYQALDTTSSASGTGRCWSSTSSRA